ncbi:MAG: hypothetical protein EpisKO_03830 [Epibacterium sp.]
MQRAASVKMGSNPTCSGAAAVSQRFRTSFQTLDFRCQPKLDIHTGCNEGAAASARAFPKAAIQQTVAALADAAVSSKGSEAQLVTFAKSWFLPAERRLHAANALGKS